MWIRQSGDTKSGAGNTIVAPMDTLATDAAAENRRKLRYCLMNDIPYLINSDGTVKIIQNDDAKFSSEVEPG